jgi:hypothetical protein
MGIDYPARPGVEGRHWSDPPGEATRAGGHGEGRWSMSNTILDSLDGSPITATPTRVT